MTPPPIAPPADLRHSTLPEFASYAVTWPSRSPVNTRPPAVAVIAATIGLGVWTFQRTVPSSALIAVTQPFHLDGGSIFPNAICSSSIPVHGLPGAPRSVSSRCSLIEVHQSIEFTKIVPDAR